MPSSCRQCSAPFEVSPDDLAFYGEISPVIAGKKQNVPPPTLCPACRWQRRMCFRNERNLYHRKCDLSGRSMISMHPSDTPFPVYHITEWLGDGWNPMDFGRDVDFSRPFFDQFRDLVLAAPHFSAFVDPAMDQNSEYTNCSSEAKNCYLITQAEKNEDCYYSRGINNCKDCCDCLRVHRCELCYECSNMRNCYRCLFSDNCDNSSDCWFSTALAGCKNCFGCHGLTRKEYHIFNKPVSKEEWDAKVGTLVLTDAVIRQMRAQSEKARLTVPQRAARVIQSEGSSGDDLLQCKNARACFDCNDLEDCAYCYEIANGAKDAMDFSMFGLRCELIYECNGCGYDMQRVLFSNHTWNNVSDLLYCESCFPSVRDCFGCFGLRRARHCILNKQYSKEEYEKLVPKIIEHMRKTGEWGEFFDPKISVYGYNESVASEFFPLSESEVRKSGWHWREETPPQENHLGPVIVLPPGIETVTDDICEKILRCEKTGKPYRITKQELDLYRRLGLPLPRTSPQQRHLDRMSSRRPRVLRETGCSRCKRKTITTVRADSKETIECEACYLASVQ